MSKYRVTIPWSGYSRGFTVYIVDAKNEEEAKELVYEGEMIYHEVVRDDTETDWTEVEVEECDNESSNS